MPYTTIHLVRHGEVDNPGHVLYERLPGFHLSDRGVRMAERTADYLAANAGPRRAAAVYSSPLERAQETAAPIVAALNEARGRDNQRLLDAARTRGMSLDEAGRLPLLEPLEIRTDARLIEAGNEFRGKTVGRGEGALWRDGNWRLVLDLYRPSWGESYRHIGARMCSFVLDVLRDHPGEEVIVVGHESPIWCLRRIVETGRPEHNMFLRHTARASVTSITFDCATHEALGVSYADPASEVE